MIVVSLVIQCCIEMTSVLWLQCVMAIYTVYTILMGLMAITLSILNGFSKFFYCWKAKWIFNKINVTLPTIPSVCCCTTLQMLGVWNCGNFQKKKQSQNCVTFDKNRNVSSYGCPHTCAKTSTPLINCILNDGLVSAMPNMQKTLLQFTTFHCIFFQICQNWNFSMLQWKNWQSYRHEFGVLLSFGHSVHRRVSREAKPAAIVLSRSRPKKSGWAEFKPSRKIRLSRRKKSSLNAA